MSSPSQSLALLVPTLAVAKRFMTASASQDTDGDTSTLSLASAQKMTPCTRHQAKDPIDPIDVGLGMLILVLAVFFCVKFKDANLRSALYLVHQRIQKRKDSLKLCELRTDREAISDQDSPRATCCKAVQSEKVANDGHVPRVIDGG